MSGGQLNSKAGDYLPLTAHSQSRRSWRSSALPPQDATPPELGAPDHRGRVKDDLRGSARAEDARKAAMHRDSLQAGSGWQPQVQAAFYGLWPGRDLKHLQR